MLLFTRYIAAATALAVMKYIPGETARSLRAACRRACLARIKEVRAWHVSEFRRLGPEHRKLRLWHREQARRFDPAAWDQEEAVRLRAIRADYT